MMSRPANIYDVCKWATAYIVTSYVCNFFLIKYFMLDHTFANNTREFVSLSWIMSPITFPLHIIFAVFALFSMCMDKLTAVIVTWW